MPVEFGEDTLAVVRIIGWVAGTVALPIGYLVHSSLKRADDRNAQATKDVADALATHLRDGATGEDIRRLDTSIQALTRRIDRLVDVRAHGAEA